MFARRLADVEFRSKKNYMNIYQTPTSLSFEAAIEFSMLFVRIPRNPY